jgi:hypothetical protein
MQFTHDLDTLKQTFTRQTTELSHLKDVLRELDPRLTLSLDPSVLQTIDEALETAPISNAGPALPLAGRRG